MPTVRMLIEAREEMQAAAAWYEEKREGLGEEFLAAVEVALAMVADTPLQFAKLEITATERDVRRAPLKRFPYAILFELRENECLVAAVAHGRRKPNYWKNRFGRSGAG